MGTQFFGVEFLWIVMAVITSSQAQRSTSSTYLHKQELTGSGKKSHNSLLQQSVEERLRQHQARLNKFRSMKIEPQVWIGASAPEDVDQIENVALSKRDDRSLHPHRGIRSQNDALSQETCRTIRYWKQINVTHNIFGDEVRIIHTEEFRQFAFVYECTREGERCNGTSADLHTTCEMRKGWAYMMYLKTASDSSIAEWNYVEVPHHCACKITPMTNPLLLK